MSRDRLTNRKQRRICKRVIVKGTLILETPTCLGNGDSDSLTNLALLRDSIDENKALLTGASVAGALRNYLNEHEYGFGKAKQDGLATTLFGATRQNDEGDQSPLIVNDSICSETFEIELRDGVKIDGKKGIAVNKAKYDIEVLVAGTEFPLYFELLIEEKEQDAQKQAIYEEELKQGLAISLSGLEKGEIAIGMKKRRGFGRCTVAQWQVWEFDLKDDRDRIAWLAFDREWSSECAIAPKEDKIEKILKPNVPIQDQRDRFIIKATFNLASPMLIRSADYSKKKTPDAVHLKSKRNDEWQSIISGTSLTGVLRHRAVRIVKTLNPNIFVPEGKDRQPEIIEQIFGFVAEDEKRKDSPKAQSSRLIVQEKVIENSSELVQTRIAIDRFTGGALHGSLFDAQPIFGSDRTCVKLEIELRNPACYEIGLFLLLLKDLWTGDLPIGGESSIGRGRLQGHCATIACGNEVWTIPQDGEKLIQKDTKALQKFVHDLKNKIAGGEK